MAKLFANSGDPDQTLHSAASDLGLHCWPFTLLGVSRLQWVKPFMLGGLIYYNYLNGQFPIVRCLVSFYHD